MSSRDGQNKKERYREKLKDELNLFLRTEIKDPRLTFVSFTKIELANDYSYANVYWDTFQTENKEGIQTALEKMSGRLRSLLAKVLDVRHTPSLKFIYDNQFEAEQEINKLLKE